MGRQEVRQVASGGADSRATAEEPSRWWRPELFLEPTGAYRIGALFALVLLVALTTVLVFYTGGTALAYPYFCLLPIVLGAALFGTRGGVVMGLLAGLALGPFMPLNVAQGTEQTTTNWLIRVGVYTALGAMTGWLFDQLRIHTRQLRERGFTSDVTGLPNRQALETDITAFVNGGAVPDGTRAFLLALKLDNVRESATNLGFAFEEALLAGIAGRLSDEVADLAHRVYHIGDDQFAILLTDASRRDCLIATQRLIDSLDRPFIVKGLPIYLDSHFGVAAYPAHEGTRVEQLLPKALVAVEDAVRGGRKYRSYDSRIDQRGLASLSLLGQLPAAIENLELELHYQPKVDLRTGAVQGVEALVRWRHPELGILLPAGFIPQVEQTGLIHQLTRWVLKTALTELNGFRQQVPELQVSVNVSARNFLDSNFFERVTQLREAADVPPHLLELELTESAILNDPNEVSRQLDRLAHTGVELAVDDFGTGYSSMLYLKQMPVTALKIDRMFVGDIYADGPAARIVEASTALAHALGMRTIAEGVEDGPTLAKLRALGCQVAQGFYLARPMPAQALQTWLSDGAAMDALRSRLVDDPAGRAASNVD